MSSTPPGVVPTSSPLRSGRFVGELGMDIVNGVARPGQIERIEELEQRFGVSRSVIREGLRVLETLGLVESRRRVGISVLDRSHWNVYDPLVIRWRLAGAGRADQLRSLTELRAGVEPMAAALAAQTCTPDDGKRLVTVAGALMAAGYASDLESFLQHDIEFHSLILAICGNEMFAKLQEPIIECLSGRHAYGLVSETPVREAARRHFAVADAIQRHEPAAAQAGMRQILQQAHSEMFAALGLPAPELEPAPRIDPEPSASQDLSASR